MRRRGGGATGEAVVFAGCALSRSHSRHQLASSSRSRCWKKGIGRGEFIFRARLKGEYKPARFRPGGLHKGGRGGKLFWFPPAGGERGVCPAGSQWGAPGGGGKRPFWSEKPGQAFDRLGFFLMAGHTCSTHWPMPSSSRSTALRVGFCGLQFMECKRRET